MEIFKRILCIWLTALAVGCFALAVFANEGPSIVALAINALFFLAGTVCAYLYIKEPIKSNKPIFLNFAVFFFLSVVAFLYFFVGYSIYPSVSGLRFYFYQYQLLAHFFLLALAVVYVVIDSVFNDFKTRSKYLVTFLVVGSTFAYYYFPILENPKYLTRTQDWSDLGTIEKSVTVLKNSGNSDPSPKDIASISNLGVWRNGIQVGVLYDDQKMQRVSELLPYLKEQNDVTLFYRPLFLNNIYMNVLCVVFVFLFFGYQYKNDPPQGAYIEKIIFLLLPYCSLEILHHYAYIRSVEYSALLDVQQIGHYLTLLNLVLLLVFFGLRLRFITSVKGEFYERELVSDAEHISRWRDAFDNLVVRHFLNPKAIHGRLFASRAPGNEA
jgi:hypothetical protein